MVFSHLTGHSSRPHPLPTPKKEQIGGNPEHCARLQTEKSMRSWQQDQWSCPGRFNLVPGLEPLLKNLKKRVCSKGALRKKMVLFSKICSQSSFICYIQLKIIAEHTMKCRWMIEICSQGEIFSGIKFYYTKNNIFNSYFLSTLPLIILF